MGKKLIYGLFIYFTFLSAISLQEEVRSWELGRSLLVLGTGKILLVGGANVVLT